MSAAMTRGDLSQGSRTYTYPLDQRAATFWYHDHRMDFTGPSVWRGSPGSTCTGTMRRPRWSFR